MWDKLKAKFKRSKSEYEMPTKDHPMIKRRRLEEALQLGSVDIRTVSDDDLLFFDNTWNRGISDWSVRDAATEEVKRRREERNAVYDSARMIKECLSKDGEKVQ